MVDSFYLAGKYLRHHRFTTLVLVASITLIIFLPAALQVIVSNAEKHFLARADATPLVVGPRGSALELVVASVYFDKPSKEVLPMRELRRIEKQKLGQAIPLHVKYQVRDCPIVGTTNDYVQTRQLRTAQGRMWEMLGECVVGARVAERLDVQVGDKIPVSTSTAFVLDSPPLRMNVVGVLAVAETPDDEAIFVDLETAWIINGLGHGHLQNAQHGSQKGKPYTEITKDNVSGVHFHGDRNGFPVTAIIVIPEDKRASDLLQGQYLSSEATAQIVRPRQVMEALLQRVVMVRSYMFAIIAVVSLVTLLLMTLVVVLSIRLRRAEIVTMSKMGCSRFQIASILGAQIGIVFIVSTGLAIMLTVVTDVYGLALVRLLILENYIAFTLPAFRSAHTLY